MNKRFEEPAWNQHRRMSVLSRLLKVAGYRLTHYHCCTWTLLEKLRDSAVVSVDRVSSSHAVRRRGNI